MSPNGKGRKEGDSPEDVPHLTRGGETSLVPLERKNARTGGKGGGKLGRKNAN